MADDALDRLLAVPIRETHYVEDMGIGAYECHGFKGHDSRPQVVGLTRIPIPDDMSRHDAETLLDDCREEITERLHSVYFGTLPRWDDEVRLVPGLDGWEIVDEYSAGPPTKAEREYEEA